MAEGSFSFTKTGGGSLEVRLAGARSLRSGLPSAALLEREIQSASQLKSIAFQARELTAWDSSALTFLVQVSELCRQRGIDMDRACLPAGLSDD
jgi:anti-anti-sigma regulatory factor